MKLATIFISVGTLFAGITLKAQVITASSLQVVSIKDFGATGAGDPANDDTQAINKALSAGYKHIYFPPGVYTLKTPLTINTDNVIFSGEGRRISTLKYTAAAGNALTLATSNDVAYFTMRDLSFIGNGDNTNPSNGLVLGSSSRARAWGVTVDNCYIGDFWGGDGVKVVCGWWLQITNNSNIDYCYNGLHVPKDSLCATTINLNSNTKISSCFNTGIICESEDPRVMDALTLDHISIQGSKSYAIAFLASKGSVHIVNGCYFEDNGSAVQEMNGSIYFNGKETENDYVVVNIEKAHFHGTLFGPDLKFGAVRATVSDCDGISKIITSHATVAHFLMNRGHGPNPMISSIYQDLDGYITAIERDVNYNLVIWNNKTGYLQGDKVLLDAHLGTAQTDSPTCNGIGTNSAILQTGSTDTAGQIRLTTGSNSASGSQVAFYFRRVYATAPVVILTPANSTAANQMAICRPFVNTFTSYFTIDFTSVENNPGGTGCWNYVVIGN